MYKHMIDHDIWWIEGYYHKKNKQTDKRRYLAYDI